MKAPLSRIKSDEWFMESSCYVSYVDGQQVAIECFLFRTSAGECFSREEIMPLSTDSCSDESNIGSPVLKSPKLEGR